MDDVNSLQPGDIARIEYSRVTPARYLDKGTNGLINITLKKRDDGGQFYGWIRDCPYIGFFDANIKASYHQGPSQFTISYAPSWRDYDDVYDVTDRSYIGNDFRVNLHEDGRSPFMYLSNPIKVKYDYAPTSKTTFSATFNASFNKDSRKSDATTFDSELGEYSNNNTSGGHSFTPSLDLFLHHDFNERNSLEAQVVGTLMSSDYRRTNYYHLPGQEEDSYIMDVDTRRRSLITEINYTHIFGQTTAIAAGYQNSLSHSKNTYKTTDYIPTLTENNNYIYLRVEQMIKRVYLSASTGMKLFWIENDMNKRHFIRNLSQFQANWNVSNSFSITGTFTYQPTIPSLSALTDYPQQISPYLVSNGNPQLKVSDSFRYTLMPSFNYKKLNLAATFGYIHMSNPASTDTRYLGDRLFLTQTVNSNRFRDGWVSLQARLSGIAGFGISAYIGLEHIETGGDGWSHDLTSLSGSVNLWWNKGPFTISYWRSFPGKSLWGQMVQRAENGDALSFSYKPNKHWTLEAQWMYMFESGGTYYPSWDYSLTAPAVTKRHIKENGNMVVISASYSADFGSLFRSSRRSLNNADSGDALLKL